MRVLVLIAFFRLYDCQEHSSARSVNLALETVLEFDNNDKSADLQIIEKVRGFLERVKGIIDNNNENRRQSSNNKVENHAVKRVGDHAGTHGRHRARNHTGYHANNELTFTDFAKKVVILLSTYNDEDLEDVVAILEDEMTKYHYKGCRFYELVENYDVRRFVSDKLYQMRTNSAKKIRLELDELTQRLANKNRGIKNKLITAYLDSLYKREDSAKFLDFLDKLALYKRKPKRMDLVPIIRNGLRSIVFDHYSHMDYSARRDFKMKLQAFWKNRLSHKSHRNIWRVDVASATRGRHIAAKKKVADSVSSSYERSTRLMMEEPQSKQRKRKRIVKNNVGKDVSRGKHLATRSTKRQTKSFVTLYPESYEHSHKRHKPRKVPRKSRQRKTYDSIEEESKLSNVRRAKKFTDSKAGAMSDSQHVIADETPKFTKIDYPRDEYKNDHIPPARKVRFNVVKRLSTTEATKKRIQTKQNKDDARRFIEALTDQKTAETSEGLDIETFSSSSSSEHEVILFRKNGNDTSLVSLDDFKITETTTETERANDTEFYVRRINDLEKELRIVKEKIVNTEKNHSDSKETPHYDSQQFFEDTPKDTDKVRHTSSKLTTTTTETPTDTEATILITTIETTEDTTTIKTTVESTTNVAPTNETLNISEVVSSGWAIDESQKVSDLLSTVTTVPADNMATTEVPTKLVSTYNQLINHLEPSRKDISNTGTANDTSDALDSEANEIKDAIHDLQIETLVEETKDVDKEKSEKIQQKVMEDVKKIMSDENEDKTTTPLHVSTINVDADPLSIMDEEAVW